MQVLQKYKTPCKVLISVSIFLLGPDWKWCSGSLEQGAGMHLKLWCLFLLLFSPHLFYFSLFTWTCFCHTMYRAVNVHDIWQALLRSDLPNYMVPFATSDLVFKKPEVCSIKSSPSLLSIFSELFWSGLFILTAVLFYLFCFSFGHDSTSKSNIEALIINQILIP